MKSKVVQVEWITEHLKKINMSDREIMDALLYIEAAKRCLQDEIEEVAYNRFTKDVTNIEVHEEKIL